MTRQGQGDGSGQGGRFCCLRMTNSAEGIATAIPFLLLLTMLARATDALDKTTTYSYNENTGILYARRGAI